MWVNEAEKDKEFEELSNQFFKKFEDIIPTYQIPKNTTLAHIKRSIKQCLKEEKNILAEIYKYDDDASKY